MTDTLANPPKDAAREALLDALLSMQSREEMAALLADLCTPAELRAFTERLQVARLLDAGGKSYREIAAEAGARPHTVDRLARYPKDKPPQGYSVAPDRIALHD